MVNIDQDVDISVFTGTALSGHYYIYQRDSKKPESWLKCKSRIYFFMFKFFYADYAYIIVDNDSQVTDIPAAEVFQTCKYRKLQNSLSLFR